MSATQCIQVSEEGFLGSMYTKTGKVLNTASAALLYQLSSWLIYPLDKSIIVVMGDSPTTLTLLRKGESFL